MSVFGTDAFGDGQETPGGGTVVNRGMRKILLALAALALTAWAANLKLYLKDGSYHIVREYQVQPDRVRYYSVERSEWEEIPLDLVDLVARATPSQVTNAWVKPLDPACRGIASCSGSG